MKLNSTIKGFKICQTWLSITSANFSSMLQYKILRYKKLKNEGKFNGILLMSSLAWLSMNISSTPSLSTPLFWGWCCPWKTNIICLITEVLRQWWVKTETSKCFLIDLELKRPEKLGICTRNQLEVPFFPTCYYQSDDTLWTTRLEHIFRQTEEILIDNLQYTCTFLL